MQDLERRSLGALIARAEARRVIDAYRAHYDHLEITLQGARVHVPYAHAHSFLNGLLRAETPSPEEPGRGPGGGDGVRVPLPAATLHLGTAWLDDLLAYANLLDLIDDYDHDPRRRTVVLHLKACSCPMDADEAVPFLWGVIQEALRHADP